MFITLEGPDASGKTTQAKLLIDKLAATYPQVEILPLAFPSKGPAGEAARELLKEHTGLKHHAIGLQSLMIVDRMAHVPAIKTCLSHGGIVVADRWAPSSVVYGTRDGLPGVWLADAQAGLPVADLNLLLAVTPEAISTRLEARGTAREIYEHMDMQIEIMAGYNHLWTLRNEYPSNRARWLWIAANYGVETVAEAIFTAVVAAIKGT